MPGYLGHNYESGTLEPNVSACQQNSSSGKSTPETFIIGDWDQFNEWFGSDDDDEDTFTEEIHMASSRSPSPSSGVRDDAHEWIELEHEDADPTSYQPGGLARHLETTSPSVTSSFDSESESESESDEVSEVQEQHVFLARRTLVIRALYPQRRASLLPSRKTTVFKPVPLKIEAKKREDQARANQCPQCRGTVFRMVSEHCLLCTMDQIKRTIQDLKLLGELKEDEYIEATRRLSGRKCAIEDENPEDYMDDTEWLDLRTEHVELCEERAEGRADLKDRLFELEAQMSQYNEWAEEDLAKSDRR